MAAGCLHPVGPSAWRPHLLELRGHGMEWGGQAEVLGKPDAKCCTVFRRKEVSQEVFDKDDPKTISLISYEVDFSF